MSLYVVRKKFRSNPSGGDFGHILMSISVLHWGDRKMQIIATMIDLRARDGRKYKLPHKKKIKQCLADRAEKFLQAGPGRKKI